MNIITHDTQFCSDEQNCISNGLVNSIYCVHHCSQLKKSFKHETL